MDKPGRSVEELLADIVLWGERISRFIGGSSYEHFAGSELHQLAVSKCIEAIGEASGAIIRHHPEFASRHPELELREAYRMRNRLSHGYDTIGWLVVWNTARLSIPDLVSRARRLIGEVRPE